jgi:glycerate 2-kinase
MSAAHGDEDNRGSVDLKAIYLTTLERCAPEALVRAHVDPAMPRNVVAIGKCAGALLDGVAHVLEVESAFVAIPEGYRLPATKAELHVGGHPHITAASFAAGRALLDYLRTHEDVLFLISGGGSACVEVPLAPYSESDVAEANARLIASGMPIGEINRERRRRSAIKGGGLAAHVRGRAVTLVYSDVSTGAADDVASGPMPGPIVIADNTTLVRTAAQIIGDSAVVVDEQLEGDVLETARALAARARMLDRGEVLVAGGEPTVVVRGDGRGGRCSELAVRFALESACEALFASSDGVDGNSGVAGFHLPSRQRPLDPAGAQAALEVSDSYAIAAQIGEPITIAPTGNNLRDLFLVTHGQAHGSQANATVTLASR